VAEDIELDPTKLMDALRKEVGTHVVWRHEFPLRNGDRVECRAECGSPFSSLSLWKTYASDRQGLWARQSSLQTRVARCTNAAHTRRTYGHLVFTCHRRFVDHGHLMIAFVRGSHHTRRTSGARNRTRTMSASGSTT